MGLPGRPPVDIIRLEGGADMGGMAPLPEGILFLGVDTEDGPALGGAGCSALGSRACRIISNVTSTYGRPAWASASSVVMGLNNWEDDKGGG